MVIFVIYISAFSSFTSSAEECCYTLLKSFINGFYSVSAKRNELFYSLVPNKNHHFYFVISNKSCIFAAKSKYMEKELCLIREKVVTFRMVKLNLLLSIFLITK